MNQFDRRKANFEKATGNRVRRRLTRARETSTFAGTPPIFENLQESNWLSTPEAASYLSLSPNALRIMVFRGKVKAYKFGARLRFQLNDLRMLITFKEG